MSNWMEKFEEKKDKQREVELNEQLNNLLDALDNEIKIQNRVKIMEKIIQVYDKLDKEMFDFDYKDYIAKKNKLAEIKYRMKQQEYNNEKESQSWNEFREEEQREEEER